MSTCPSCPPLQPAGRGKLGDLVGAGAVLVGERPLGGLGFGEHGSRGSAPGARSVRTLSATAAARGFGRGRHLLGLAEALCGEGVAPDLAFEGPKRGGHPVPAAAHVRRGHLYSVPIRASGSASSRHVSRMDGHAPEIWHADSGTMMPVTYEVSDHHDPGSTEHGAARGLASSVFQRHAEATTWTAPVTRRSRRLRSRDHRGFRSLPDWARQRRPVRQADPGRKFANRCVSATSRGRRPLPTVR